MENGSEDVSGVMHIPAWMQNSRKYSNMPMCVISEPLREVV